MIRHGVPVCDHATRIRGSDFKRWVAAYDCAPLDPQRAPPASVRARVAATTCLATSELRRSLESAEALAPGRLVLSDPLFNEAAAPAAIPWRLALRPDHWDARARIAWLAGWAGDVESFRAATARADRAAERLIGLARTHGSVTLVGHGMLNTLIARALRRRGWKGGGSARAYWGLVALQQSA